MIVHLLLLSRYVDNHGHLWSRDFKLTYECVYALDSLLPAKAVNERVNLNSARETLAPVDNKGSHLTYFLSLSSANPSAIFQRKSKGAKIRPLLLMRRPTILFLLKLLMKE